jgi:hypothetical protein
MKKYQPTSSTDRTGIAAVHRTDKKEKEQSDLDEKAVMWISRAQRPNRIGIVERRWQEWNVPHQRKGSLSPLTRYHRSILSGKERELHRRIFGVISADQLSSASGKSNGKRLVSANIETVKTTKR